MAKKSMVHRDKVRTKKVEKHKVKRDACRQGAKQGDEDAINQLNALPVDSSPSRQRRRCRSCGRPRGVSRRFGVCRICLRQLAMSGLIPGLQKSSW